MERGHTHSSQILFIRGLTSKVLKVEKGFYSIQMALQLMKDNSKRICLKDLEKCQDCKSNYSASFTKVCLSSINNIFESNKR